MEDTTQETSVESTSQETSSAPTEATTSTAESTGSLDASHTSELPTFTPNYKFKVMDEEKEFDEFLRPIIKDEDTQKKIKELYEKAYGLDFVKPKYESAKQKLEQIEPQFQSITNDLKMVGQHLKNQDLGSFFKTFKLTDEQILQYAINKLEYAGATPERKKQMDDADAFKRNNASIALENEGLKAFKEQYESAQFKNAFDSALSSPHVSPIAQAFDARAGEPGAFAKAIIQYGAVQSRQAGRDVPVSEVVTGFIKTFGLTAPQQSPAASETQVAAGSGQPAQRKETLPKLAGSGGSPVAAKVKTLDDLKKKQQEVLSTGHGVRI